MIGFLTSKVLLWICGGLLVALAITGSFAGCEHHNANEARADRDAMKSERNSARGERDRLVKDNESQHATIAMQDEALNKWLQLGVTPEEVEELLARIRKKDAELDKLMAANAREKEKDDGNPDCEKLRQVDFERACPHRARVLRGYENRLPRQPGHGSDAGVRPPAR